MNKKEIKRLEREQRKIYRKMYFDNSPIGWMQRIIPIIVIPMTIYFIIKFLLIALE